MVNLWAKVMRNNKIVKQLTLEIEKFNINDLHEYLTKICYGLDVSTPLVLDKHNQQLIEFNSTSFLAVEFIEPFDYDSLVIELY